MVTKKQGDIAWCVMALGILSYDLYAIKTQKFETMSSALWRSLSHPVKSPILWFSWGTLTYHLFGSKNARTSTTSFLNTILKKGSTIL